MAERPKRQPRKIPEATVARLPLYLRSLLEVTDAGTPTISSERLAELSGVNAAKVRKDLSYLGSYGTRGVGYDVEYLLFQMSRELGLTHDWPVVIVGLGNLGHALANYGGFRDRGFPVAALVDADPAVVGTDIGGMTVRHVDELGQVAAENPVAIGIIATPASAAQDVADRLIEAGITSILNFAPTILSVPEAVSLRKVDLAVELQILSFYQQRRRADGAAAVLEAAEAAEATGAAASAEPGPAATGPAATGPTAWPARPARRRREALPMPVEAPLYPVNLIVSGRPVLVVGGGRVAAQKVRGLVKAGAAVTVVAPEVDDEVRDQAVTVDQRRYRRGEVTGYRLAVAATGDPAVNQQVYDDGEAAGVWVNSADDPERCSVTLPARVDRGRLMVTVSTGGYSPAVASWVRDRIAAELGPEFDTLVGHVGRGTG